MHTHQKVQQKLVKVVSQTTKDLQTDMFVGSHCAQVHHHLHLLCTVRGCLWSTLAPLLIVVERRLDMYYNHAPCLLYFIPLFS